MRFVNTRSPMSQMAALLARFPALSKIGNLPKPALIGIASGVLALLVVLILWARPPEYRVLFSNLQDRDGGAIVSALTQMNVPYELTNNGTAIMVPADQVYRTRLQLAEQGLPHTGSVGFELMDQTRFGASEFTEQITYQRALEGELASSVEALNTVQGARVHLAMPRESLFVRDRQEPTASVLVTLYPGRTLSEAQVAAITWLVSSSVPKLTPENVSIVDQTGRLLTAPRGEEGMESQRHKLVAEAEQRAVQRIMTLLTPLVGAGNVRAQASAEYDFATREQTSEVYKPNQSPGEAAVRSKQTSSSDQYKDQPPEGVPGALTNQPPANAQAPITTPQAQGAQGQNGQQANGNNTATAQGGTNGNAANPANFRRDATINYEVDRTISHVKDPVGRLKRMSVAVVVNYRPDETGEYKPLPPETLASIESLVRDAMGYSADRGDTVSVVNSRFNDTIKVALPVWKDPEYRAMALEGLKYLLIVIALFVAWRKIVRPAVQSLSAGLQARAPVKMATPAVDLEEEAKLRTSDISRYEDNLKAAKAMAEKDPRAVAMVLRAWMDKNGKS
jgi:flagellar M-ring protein FliF